MSQTDVLQAFVGFRPLSYFIVIVVIPTIIIILSYESGGNKKSPLIANSLRLVISDQAQKQDTGNGIWSLIK